MRSRTAIYILCCVLSLASSVLGQGFGTISGAISDPSGASLAQATVVATEIATGLSRSSVASQEGYYVLNSLRPGMPGRT